MSRLKFKNYWIEGYLFSRRILVVAFFVGILLFALIARLVYLQIIQHKTYTTLSNENQLTLIPIDPNRGLIYDKHGVLLADNVPTFSLDIVPERVPHVQQMLRALQKIIHITPEDIKQFEKALKQKRPIDGVPLKLNLTEEEVARFYLVQYEFPGVHITGRLMRYYPLGDAFVSALGYVSRISEDDLTQLDATNYAASSYVGKIGIEKHYENLLHGHVGYQQIETNANGHTVRILKYLPPAAGVNLYLSLDSGLQKATEDALGDEQGAVVAIEPATGQVLAFVGNPRYDPNIFVRGVTTKEFRSLRMDVKKPLYNRPLRGLYAPGSTVKPMVALQLLNEDVVSTDTTISDPGWFKLPNNPHIFNDWRKSGHGVVNLRRAITESCDVYFYTMGLRLGIDRLHDIESRFGLGSLTGLDADEELAGVAPSPAWKEKALKQAWYPGDTVNASIGQGYTLVTPLQMAVATAVIANHGIRYKPRFVQKWQRSDGMLIEPKPIELPPVLLQGTHDWSVVIADMRASVDSPSGTAHRTIANSNYTVAGKTGTAQVFRPKQYGDEDSPSIPKKYRSHSWFISFAPADKPRIALAVIVENHPHQAQIVARKILDYYLLPGHGKSERKNEVSSESLGPSD
jgi:penicillin-binding protein 2